jgi:hypothetical protein
MIPMLTITIPMKNLPIVTPDQERRTLDGAHLYEAVKVVRPRTPSEPALLSGLPYFFFGLFGIFN